MPRIVAFVTHSARSDARLAAELKQEVGRHFSGAIEMFVSSDPDSLPAGTRWLEELTDKLKACQVQILLLSPDAITRPWIHFEAGAGWARGDILQIPLCHSGLDRGALPLPLSLLQAGELADPASCVGIASS